MHLRSLLLGTLSTLALVAPPGAWAQGTANPCGDLSTHYGPFDFRRDKKQLPVVEQSHFTPPVESLIRGVSGPIGAELDYVLHAFPNHPRALATMVRLSEKERLPQPRGANYPVECYFERAVRFAPDDNVVRMLYASFLGKRNRVDDAVKLLDGVAQRAGDNSFTHHNLGLLYVELKQYDRALAQAHRAIALGFERPDLRQALVRAGKWQDPPAAPAPAAAASAATDGAAPAAAPAPAAAAASK